MRNILNIVKKELDKIFKSPRLIFSTFILPGLLIFVMYSFMGLSAESQIDKVTNHEYKVCISGEKSDTLESILKNIIIEDVKVNVNIEYKVDAKEKIEEALKNEAFDIWIICPKNFEDVVSKNKEEIANVELYFYTSNQFSASILDAVIESLLIKQEELNPKKYMITPITTDFANDEEKSSYFIGMLAPVLIMTFIFAGALSIGADSIAGEKERGTLATMLAAPINKNEIVLGKIFSAIIITVISGICSFIGLIASIGNLVKGSGEVVKFSLNLPSGLQLFTLILLISLMAVSLFLVASTYAKSTKEATMYAMPVYILGIISGTFTMYEVSIPTTILPYIIPIYNLTLGLKGVFIGSLDPLYFWIIFGSNIIYFVLILQIVRKMFSSEKIIFK